MPDPESEPVHVTSIADVVTRPEGVKSVNEGAIVSTLTLRDFTLAVFPATSVAPYRRVCAPSESVIGPEYAVHMPPSRL